MRKLIAMAAEVEMDPSPLLTCSEEDFDNRLQKLSIKELVVVISALQNEMAEQQTRFDDLGTKFASLDDPNSTEGTELSEEMLQCQGHLSVLMGRNMKCFSQQAASENQELLESLHENAAQLQQQTSARNVTSAKSNDSDHTDSVGLHTNSVPNGVKLVDISSDERALGLSHTGETDTDSDIITESKVVKHITFGVNMAANGSVPTDNHKADEEKINFSAARSMFEGGGAVKPAVRKFSVPAKMKMAQSDSVTGRDAVDGSASARNGLPEKEDSDSVRADPPPRPPQETSASNAPLSSSTSQSSEAQRSKSTSSAVSASNFTKPSSKAAPWQSQLKKLARNEFSVSKSSQNTNNMPAARPGVGGPLKAVPKSMSHGNVTSLHQKPAAVSAADPAASSAPAVKAPWKSKEQSVSAKGSNAAAANGIKHSVSADSVSRAESKITSTAQSHDKTMPPAQSHDKTTPPALSHHKTTPPALSHDKTMPPAQSHHKTTPPAQSYDVVDSKPLSLSGTSTHYGAKSTAKPQPSPAIPPTTPVTLSHGDIQSRAIVTETDRLYQPVKTEAHQSSVAEAGSDNKEPVRASKRVAALYMSEKFDHVDGDGDGDEKVQERVTLKDWNPIKLLTEMYEVKLAPDSDSVSSYISIEGYLEKLPLNKRKATLLKTWKRRYFKLSQGYLYYYEVEDDSQIDSVEEIEEEISADKPDSSTDTESASGYFQLMGGTVELLGGRMLGLDDGRGRYMVVRCPTDPDTDRWHRAMESNTEDNICARWVKPVLTAPPSNTQKVVIVDLGSCSVRAGLLGEQACLPQVFFPTIAAKSRTDSEILYGFDAYAPSVRANSTLVYPVKPSAKVDKFTIDMDLMPGLFDKVFNELKIKPSQYRVMLSVPAQISDKLKEQFMDLLVKRFSVQGVNIQPQTMLALYCYSATSGIIVDIGERLEILPVTEGYVVEGGVTRQPYGGQRVTEVLNTSFTERRYRFFSEVENLLVRVALEKMCFVSSNYKQDIQAYAEQSNVFHKSLSLAAYDLPSDTYQTLENDLGLFRSPEGLFDLHLWGMDNPPLHKLVQKAILACPMDARREMWRSIYLSGGITTLPGFQQRLQSELNKLVPSSITVQVHATPQRYHAAFLGASALAGMAAFQEACISAEEWKSQGPKTLRKWHLY